MKIDQAIVLCLLKNKQVTLKGIGKFSIDDNFPENPDPEKPFTIPPDAIRFTHDPKAPEDAELVNFIAQNTNKMKSLAASDIDSYLTLGREFLNIGNPFTIQNLGSLEKIGSGQLHFTPGHLILKPVTLSAKTEVEEKTAHDENQFEKESEPLPFNSNNRRSLILIVLLVLIGLVVAWYFGFRKKEPQNENKAEAIVPILDTGHQKPPPAETITAGEKMKTILLEDTLGHRRVIPFNTYTFLIVVKTTRNKASAMARLRKLENYGRNVILYTEDSITYKVAHPFDLPLRDTTKVLDSLNSFYYLGGAHVELK